MSNTPKKVVDPTEAAMAAIQEALKVRDAEMTTSARPAPPPVETPLPLAREEARRPAAEPDLPPLEARRPAREPAPQAKDDLFIADGASDVEPGQPANDDWKSVGQILQSTRVPSAQPLFIAAGVASVAWVIFAAILTTPYLSQLQQSFAPALLALLITFLGPVAFFFAVAHTIQRSREMRALSQSMAEVALRLSEPEGLARESIVTVGQAIRREVAAMGDGVERALARAAELESLVQSEVAALERAYNDNEVRIRGMLDDLASQRDSLIGQASRSGTPSPACIST
jgi:hypothetical protein